MKTISAFLMWLIHRIAHQLGRNQGRVETWTQDGTLMVGFRCGTCDKLQGIHSAPKWLQEI